MLSAIKKMKKTKDKKQPSFNRSRKERIVIAFFLGAILSMCLFYVYPLVADSVKAIIVGFVVAIIAIGLVVFVITFQKEWILNKIFGVSTTDIDEVKNSLTNLYESSVNKDWHNSSIHLKETLSKASTYYVWITFRRWVIGVFYVLFLAFAGLLGSVLIFNQNELITKQNEIITSQNSLIQRQTDRLDQQTFLQEAERRSSLVFLFGNIMDAIDRELKDDYNNNNLRDLSPQLVGRIVALSSRLQPYLYLAANELIERPLSPERGQLLVSLIGSELDTITYNQIFSKANFSYADLAEAEMSGSYLKNIDLRSSSIIETNLSNSHIIGGRFSHSNFSGVNLENTRIKNSDFFGANLEVADFSNTVIENTSFNGSLLGGAIFENTHLINVSFSMVNMSYVVFFNPTIEQINLENARCSDLNCLTEIAEHDKTVLDRFKIIDKIQIDTLNDEKYYVIEQIE